MIQRNNDIPKQPRTLSFTPTASAKTETVIVLALLTALLVLLLYNLLISWQFAAAYFQRDEWEHYEHFINSGFAEFLFSRNIGHAMVFPRLFYASTLVWFEGISTPLVALGLALNLGAATILATVLWRTRGENIPLHYVLLALALTVAWMFSLIRYPDFTWGLHLHNNIVVFSMIVAGFALWRHLEHYRDASIPGTLSSPWWWLIITCGIVASLSFGTGLALWPALIVVMFVYRIPVRQIVLVAGAGLAVIIGVFALPHDFSGQDANPVLPGWSLPTPPEVAIYAIELLGQAIPLSILSAQQVSEGIPRAISIMCGLTGLALLGWCSFRIFRSQSRALHYMPGLALGWFCAGAAFSIALGRADFEGGFGSGVDYRLAGWSLLFWLALVMLVAQRFLISQGQLRVRAGFAVFATIGLVLLLLSSIQTTPRLLDQDHVQQRGALTLAVAPQYRGGDLLRLHVFGAEKVRDELAPVLRENKLNLFSRSWAHLSGESLREHYQIDHTANCAGTWRWIREMQAHTRLYQGWATDASNNAFNTIFLVENDTIIGVGQPVWISNLTDLSEDDPELPGQTRYFLGVLLGHNPGWTGITAYHHEQSDDADPTVYGVMNASTVCRIHRR